jgi:peroxiredoxin
MLCLTVVLMAVVLPSQAKAQTVSPTPEEQYASLVAEYRESLKQATSGIEAAKTKEERQKAIASYPTVDRIGPRFLELARKYPRSSAACDALVWIVGQGRVTSDYFPSPRIELMGEAMERLAKDHVDDRRVGVLCRSLVVYASPLRDTFLRSVYEKATNREVRGYACLSLAEYLAAKSKSVARGRSGGQADRAKSVPPGQAAYLEQLRSADPAALSREAETLFEKTIREYGDLSISRRGEKITFAQLAESGLRGLRQIGVGKAAPEIEGEDVDGKPLRLSDYRGKVVVLVFSGEWCGPCRAMYPQERELVSRLKDKPFALLGVDTDTEKQTLRKVISDGQITWRCWWDGAMDGPICKAWDIRGFPTVFVIDALGLIRDSMMGGGKPLDEAVDGLLKEIEKSAGPR